MKNYIFFFPIRGITTKHCTVVRRVCLTHFIIKVGLASLIKELDREVGGVGHMTEGV